ncbi:MAG: hypothetical protein JWN81_2286 [Solirubrobacterales bacterium]|jgi:hypothetical protein|nr:hypothetical protein [Solirubrobacterales bacterium]
MTAAWIAVAAAALAAALTVLALAWRRRAREAGGTTATISNLEDSTTLDTGTGAVRSLQTADLELGERALREIWSPMHLERLARTYWRFLSRVTLGLIRVRYTEHERSLVLLAWPLKLITFQAPEYEMDPARGLVRWRIARGLLVAKRGCDGGGYLQIEVRRSPAEDPALVRLHVEVEVANFYPSIAAGLGRWLYEVTQSRIHVLITHGFLRSLARLDLAESKVRRLAPQDMA